jgi:hypothetical protein
VSTAACGRGAFVAPPEMSFTPYCSAFRASENVSTRKTSSVVISFQMWASRSTRDRKSPGCDARNAVLIAPAETPVRIGT